MRYRYVTVAKNHTVNKRKDERKGEWLFHFLTCGLCKYCTIILFVHWNPSISLVTKTSPSGFATDWNEGKKAKERKKERKKEKEEKKGGKRKLGREKDWKDDRYKERKIERNWKKN